MAKRKQSGIEDKPKKKSKGNLSRKKRPVWANNMVYLVKMLSLLCLVFVLAYIYFILEFGHLNFLVSVISLIALIILISDTIIFSKKKNTNTVFECLCSSVVLCVFVYSSILPIQSFISPTEERVVNIDSCIFDKANVKYLDECSVAIRDSDLNVYRIYFEGPGSVLLNSNGRDIKLEYKNTIKGKIVLDYELY